MARDYVNPEYCPKCATTHLRTRLVKEHPTHTRLGERTTVRGHRQEFRATRMTPGKTRIPLREGKLKGFGWEVHESEEARMKAARRAVKAQGYATTVRELIALHNVSGDEATKRAAYETYAHLHNLHEQGKV